MTAMRRRSRRLMSDTILQRLQERSAALRNQNWSYCPSGLWSAAGAPRLLGQGQSASLPRATTARRTWNRRMRALLTDEQVARYDRLRGYTASHNFTRRTNPVH